MLTLRYHTIADGGECEDEGGGIPMMATSVRTRGPVAANVIPDAELPSAVANIAAATPTMPRVGSGWRWGRDWGPAWDSPDVEVMVYVADGEVSDGR